MIAVTNKLNIEGVSDEDDDFGGSDDGCWCFGSSCTARYLLDSIEGQAVKAAVAEAAGAGYANVQGINQTASYRCMGCYALEINIEVSEGDNVVEKVLEVRTQAVGPQKVKVSSVTLK